MFGALVPSKGGKEIGEKYCIMGSLKMTKSRHINRPNIMRDLRYPKSGNHRFVRYILKPQDQAMGYKYGT